MLVTVYWELFNSHETYYVQDLSLNFHDSSSDKLMMSHKLLEPPLQLFFGRKTVLKPPLHPTKSKWSFMSLNTSCKNLLGEKIYYFSLYNTKSHLGDKDWLNTRSKLQEQNCQTLLCHYILRDVSQQ